MNRVQNKPVIYVNVTALDGQRYPLRCSTFTFFSAQDFHLFSFSPPHPEFESRCNNMEREGKVEEIVGEGVLPAEQDDLNRICAIYLYRDQQKSIESRLSGRFIYRVDDEVLRFDWGLLLSYGNLIDEQPPKELKDKIQIELPLSIKWKYQDTLRTIKQIASYGWRPSTEEYALSHLLLRAEKYARKAEIDSSQFEKELDEVRLIREQPRIWRRIKYKLNKVH